jgi:hypothetical protein
MCASELILLQGNLKEVAGCWPHVAAAIVNDGMHRCMVVTSRQLLLLGFC